MLLSRSASLFASPRSGLAQLTLNDPQSDLTGNVKKIRDRETAAPAESATLQELVKNELKTKKHTASEGLLWLVRCVL